MTELAQQPASGDIGAEIDKALLEKNRAIDNEPGENAESPPAKEPAKSEVKEDPIQKRIDKLTREKYDARRQSDITKYENEQLKARLAALEAKPAEAAPREPTMESVGYDESKYRLEMLKWLRTEAQSVAREETQKALSGSQAQRIHSEFEQRQADFAKSTPDYIEKVLERDTLPISDEMQDALKLKESGPQIAYYLCNNEDKAREIMSLPPLLQAIEIGRIEASLEKPKSPPKVSQAPPPPAKLDATESPKELDLKDSSGWTDKQFTKWRRQHMK